ncbi:MAG TPA: LysR substrate-binding domain-containing protein [Burkholderiaceae bacterium]|nr:LysR substrate-binding domain-containing protein [Burkholderiaceae bacterium]
MTTYNYKHLFYFWVVAKEGGMSRAAERLGMAVQTISAQVRELERSLGYQLLKPVGRNVGLTEAGQAAYAQAEQLFQLGEQLPEVLRATTQLSQIALRVGISDGLPKMAIPLLLGSVLTQPNLRLECHDDEFEDLLADLALHRLDLVLADRPAPTNDNVRVYSHALGTSPIAWFGTADLAARWAEAWSATAHLDPGSDGQANDARTAATLSQLPLLLPTPHSAVRRRLSQWFEQHHIHPRVVGEFEDSALLTTFAATGMGVIPSPGLVSADLSQRMGLQQLGHTSGVSEHFYLIGSERKVMHPLVKQVLAHDHDLFNR